MGVAIKGNRKIQRDIQDYIHAISQALIAQFDLEVTPATRTTSAAVINAAVGADSEYLSKFAIALNTTDGVECLWADGYSVPVSVSIGSASGGVSIQGQGASGNIVLQGGQGAVTLVFTGTWAEGEKVTFKAAPSGVTILDKSITVKTHVDTIAA